MRFALLLPFVLASFAEAAAPTFERDVMAVLSRAGCNQGACHGNLSGKGGLKLSLRGEDPEFDYTALVRAFETRRVDPLRPDESLLLQKAVGKLGHGGGARLTRDAQGYALIREWMAAGALGPDGKLPKLVRLEVTPTEVVLRDPDDHVRLRAVAHFADGAARDVTALAALDLSNTLAEVSGDGVIRRRELGEVTVVVRYLNLQTPVRIAFVPQRPEFVAERRPPQNLIDELVATKLEKLTINPSPVCDDVTFVRRVFLDVIGLPPTAEEARAFVADETVDKRERLLDALLYRPEFADFWTLKWSDLLRNEEKVLDRNGVDAFHRWIRDSLALGRRMDVFVRDLVAAEGSTYDNPPANFYRSNRDPSTRAETAARLFLGVRLQCAKCHNHPFDRWTMDDYYSWSAVFARIDYKINANQRRDKLDLNEFNGEQFIIAKTNGEVKNPRTGKSAPPRFLGVETSLAKGDSRLQPLADWLTSPDNVFFARAQANWIWYHLLGRGLVEPIDDVRVTNPASNPPLLEALGANFVEHQFDLRQSIRTICNSRTYQASAVPNATNAGDEENFSRTYLRRLSAEQLVDAQSRVLGLPATFRGYPVGTRAAQLRGVNRDRESNDGDRMLKDFGKPDRLLACECERSSETTMKQAFVLIGSESLERRLADENSFPLRLAKSERTNAEIVTELYWTVLNRPPNSAELSTAEALLAAGHRPGVVVDFTWALLNSKEFLFRH